MKNRFLTTYALHLRNVIVLFLAWSEAARNRSSETALCRSTDADGSVTSWAEVIVVAETVFLQMASPGFEGTSIPVKLQAAEPTAVIAEAPEIPKLHKNSSSSRNTQYQNF